MSRPQRYAAVVALGVSLLVLGTSLTPRGQGRPPQPFAPTWANLAGATVFKEKGCGRCHAIRGIGPTVGPELARIEKKSFFDLGAAMSNHLRGVNIPRPTLTPEEAASLIAFIFTLQYYDVPGDPKTGEKLFTDKGCVRCHEVGGRGGRIGPSLDFLKRANSPILVAAALWNHGPEMTETLRAEGVPRPTFAPGELADLIAYVQAAATGGGATSAQVVPGAPEQGERLVAERRCLVCHTIGGQGGRVGPELGRRQHVSLTEFAARMWNHGSKMAAKMRELGIQVPRVNGQEMADIVAYLYATHYFDETVDPQRGQRVVRDKDCLTCHAILGEGPTIGADLTSYSALRSSAGLVAALWNHPRFLEARKQEVPWPLLTGQELADMAAYLGTIAGPGTQRSN